MLTGMVVGNDGGNDDRVALSLPLNDRCALVILVTNDGHVAVNHRGMRWSHDQDHGGDD